MHKNEINIDDIIVEKLLSEQFPEFANLKIKKIKHSGTDSAIFKLGKNKCVRLPRIKSAAKQTIKEQKFLPDLANYLPLQIPSLIGCGKPSKEFPFNWSIYNWIEGKNAYDSQIQNKDQAAKDLAKFINSLQRINTENAPKTRRGQSLITQNEAVKAAILDLEDTIDPTIITNIWHECLNAPNWNKQDVWLHGDLLPSNLLIKDNKLNAVIDFGLAGIGDPACDLIPAWNLFNGASRSAFKNALEVDNATWIRGKGWALSIALIIIPYYKNTNPELTSIAKRMINEIIKDYC